VNNSLWQYWFPTPSHELCLCGRREIKLMWRILSGCSCYLTKYHHRNPQWRTVRNLMFPVAILPVGVTESCQDYHFRKFPETITNVTRKTEAYILDWTGSKPYCTIVTVLYPFLCTYILIAEKLCKIGHGIPPNVTRFFLACKGERKDTFVLVLN
jgi:hypothetical protein